MLRGAEGLMAVCKSKIHEHTFQRNAEGTLSWEEVECLGACVNAPMVMIDRDTYEDLTPARLEEIIDTFAAGNGASVKVGPQIDRWFSAPEGGQTALTGEFKPFVRAEEKPPEAEAAPAVTLPPSEAAKPKSTDAETNAALKSPADGKTALPAGDPKAEPAKVETTEPAKTESVEPAKAGPKPSLDDKNRPAAVAKPEVPDDLKLISGVGPKIEATLHDIGIFTYAQVASWGAAEREWVDGYLSFRGRIDRDDWVNQAKALAKGGEAEYIKVFGKKPR